MAQSAAKISPRPGLAFHSWLESKLTSTTTTSGRRGANCPAGHSWSLALLPPRPFALHTGLTLYTQCFLCSPGLGPVSNCNLEGTSLAAESGGAELGHGPHEGLDWGS